MEIARLLALFPHAGFGFESHLVPFCEQLALSFLCVSLFAVELSLHRSKFSAEEYRRKAK